MSGSGVRGRSRRRGREPHGPLDSDLPLEALNAALDPVRRAVAFAVRSDHAPKHMGLALAAPLAAAAALELPSPLGALVEGMAAAGARLGDSPDDEVALAELFASIQRLDALLGLPVAIPIRSPKKRRYRPQTDAPEAPKPARGASAGPAEEPAPREVEPPWSGRWDTPIDELVERASAVGGALDDATVEDLLGLIPTSITVLDGVQGAGRPLPEGLVAVGGRVHGRVTVCHRDGGRTERCRLVGAGPLWCRWSGTAPHPSLLPKGSRVVLAGHVVDGELSDPEVVVPRADGAVVLAHYGREDDRAVREALVQLRPLLKRLRDPVSADTLRRFGLMERSAAALAMHEHPPQADETYENARRRLAFDEALLASLGAAGLRYQRHADRGIPHTVVQSGVARVGVHFDLLLSDAQQEAFEDVKRDLRRGSPMRRVLTGEVGAGKGAVALLAIATVAEAKGQVMVLGPDDAEVEHRFLHSEPLLRELGFVVRRVSDSPGESVRDAIKRGEIHVVFGTHALLGSALPFRRLGLVLSAERFPFGAAATTESPHVPRADLLVVTQVPVGSRVLATAYSDFDVSVVANPARRPAHIQVCAASERSAAYSVLRDAVDVGQQGMVLFPRVRGADALDLGEAARVVDALGRTELSGARLGLLHSDQPLEERRRVFSDLVHRRIDVLVTTTALEDGPTVPGLTATVVEQADHVEQWRLHRVIGFLSATPLPSVAVLVVGEHADPDAEARIQRVLAAPNGYALTEARVRIRGVDACVVAGSAPLPEVVRLDLDRDRDLFLAAREEAHRMLRADPGLRRGSHQELSAEVQNAWEALWPVAPEGWPCPFISEGQPEKRRRRRRRRRK